MKKYLALGCLGLGLMVSPLLGGLAGSAVPSNPKLGVINIEDTLASSPAGKRTNEAFEKLRKTKQSMLDTQQDELKKADADLLKRKGAMSAPDFESARASLEKKFVDLQQNYVKLERELAQDRTKLIQELLKQAEPKIAALARAEGITIILDQSATVWTDPATDLTQKLNAEMK